MLAWGSSMTLEPPISILLGGSSHLVSGLVHPSYKWINPTYPIYNWGYNPLTSRGMSHQVSLSASKLSLRIPAEEATRVGRPNQAKTSDVQLKVNSMDR